LLSERVAAVALHELAARVAPAVVAAVVPTGFWQ
jgi:hypothetical protein